jgi:DNA-binding LacI/PurR family transcriptional regulator
MARRRFSAEPHAPKHQQVFESLSKDILSGRYQRGQKIPSEAALVQQFQTSRITVGRALRELAQRGLVERIAGSGTYVRHASPGEEGLVFGLLIPGLGETEIFEPICRGIASAPQAGRHALLWGNTAPEQALQLCDDYLRQRVAGIFFAPLETGDQARDINLTIMSRFAEARIPIILLDRRVLPFASRIPHDLVGIDNRRAGYLATEHLLNLGAPRVVFMAHSGGANTIAERIAGFREALLSNGISLEANPVWTLDAIANQSIRPGDGFVCANDRTAGELMQVLLARGYRIPKDVRVVGIDDVEYASLLPVPLTTVHQPCREIGEAALSAMLDRVARPNMFVRDILVACHLVVRESCGAKRQVP